MTWRKMTFVVDAPLNPNKQTILRDVDAGLYSVSVGCDALNYRVKKAAEFAINVLVDARRTQEFGYS